jgi:hypothetical protein
MIMSTRTATMNAARRRCGDAAYAAAVACSGPRRAKHSLPDLPYDYNAVCPNHIISLILFDD